MNLIGDKILVRISKELRDSIFEKEIDTPNGKVKLWQAIQATDEMDERLSFLNVHTAIVEEVSHKIDWIKKGDTALINYDVCNSAERFVRKEGEDDIYWVQVNTTYHTEEKIAYQNIHSQRDQIVHSAGDYDTLSPLLGIIREGELIANNPYVFLTHESNIKTMVSKTGLMYEQEDKIFEREVLSVHPDNEDIAKGDRVVVDDFDIFAVKIGDFYAMDCINCCDILCVKYL